jgi:hypothetical protein
VTTDTGVEAAMINQAAVDRMKSAFDKYLNPNDCEKGGSTRRSLGLLKEKGVKLSNLLPVAEVLDEVAPLARGPFAPGGTFQSSERLAPIAGSLMNDTGLKEVKANLAEHVDALKKNCPELVQEYEVQFS